MEADFKASLRQEKASLAQEKLSSAKLKANNNRLEAELKKKRARNAEMQALANDFDSYKKRAIQEKRVEYLKGVEEAREEKATLSTLVEDDSQKFIKGLMEKSHEVTFDEWAEVEKNLDTDCETWKKKFQDEVDKWKKDKKEKADQKEEDRCVNA